MNSQIQRAKARLEKVGFKMTFLRIIHDMSKLPPAGGSFPRRELRKDFYGIKTTPKRREFIGDNASFVQGDLVIVLPGDVCHGLEGPQSPQTSDFLYFSGRTWSIRSFLFVEPELTGILFKAQVYPFVAGDTTI